jgi:hypothetical protein
MNQRRVPLMGKTQAFGPAARTSRANSVNGKSWKVSLSIAYVHSGKKQLTVPSSRQRNAASLQATVLWSLSLRVWR